MSNTNKKKLMRKKYHLFLLFFIFIHIGLYAQNTVSNIDSLYQQVQKLPDTPEKVNRLLALNKQSHYTRPDIVEKALEIASLIYDINGIGKAYDAKGYMERRKNHFLKSVEYHKRALGFLENSTDTLLKVKCLNNLGVSLRKLNDEKGAYKYYMTALDLAKASKNEKQIARILNGIGNVFVNTEEYEKALYYFKKSLAYELKNKNPKGQEYNYANIGEIFILKKKFDSAEYYLNKSVDLASVIYSDKKIGIEYNLLALLYKNKKDYLKAIYYYDKALPMLKSRNIKRYCANSYINRGLSKLAINQTKPAYEDIQKGLKIAKEIKSKENISLGYDALVSYYSKINNYKKALDAHILAKKFHDSIVNITTKNSIISTQIIYETKEKDNQIKQLAYEKELEKKNSKRNFIIMLGVGIAGLIAFVFLYMFFNLRRKNIDLELEQKNSEIQSYLMKIKELEQQMNKDAKIPAVPPDSKLKEFNLTKREIDVLKLIAKGYSNDEIAEEIFISKNTVKSHIKNIYLKLDVKNRIQVVRKLQGRD